MIDKTSLHPIAEYSPRLQPSVITEEINNLLNVGKKYLDARAQGIVAARKVSDDFKKEAKARRQHELIRGDKESPAKLAQALQTIRRTSQAMREKIQADARPKGPETDTRALLEYMQRRDLLAELKQLSSEDRARILRQTAAAGDRSVLNALQSSLLPVVNQLLIDSAEKDYVLATQGDAVEALQLQEEVEGEAVELVRKIHYQAGKMITEAERAGEILPLPTGERPPSQAAHLSDSEKASLIGQVGLEGFKAILSGEQPLPPAFWSEPAKEAFATEHGGEAWEGFLAGTWTPPEPKAKAPPPPAEYADIMASLRSTAPAQI